MKRFMIYTGLIVLLSAAAASGQPYSSVYDMIMRDSNATRTKQLLTRMITKGVPAPIVQRYQYIMPYVQGTNSTITEFAATPQAFEDLQLYGCMTQTEFDDYATSNPDLVLSLLEQHTANTTTTVTSDEFKNGTVLPTFGKDLKLKLIQRTDPEGTTRWVLPGVSYNGSDVTIVQTDVKAGDSIVHWVDGLITTDAQRKLFRAVQPGFCNRPGAKEAAAASVAAARSAAASATPAAGTTSAAATSAAVHSAALGVLSVVLSLLSLAVVC